MNLCVMTSLGHPLTAAIEESIPPRSIRHGHHPRPRPIPQRHPSDERQGPTPPAGHPRSGPHTVAAGGPPPTPAAFCATPNTWPPGSPTWPGAENVSTPMEDPPRPPPPARWAKCRTTHPSFSTPGGHPPSTPAKAQYATHDPYAEDDPLPAGHDCLANTQIGTAGGPPWPRPTENRTPKGDRRQGHPSDPGQDRPDAQHGLAGVDPSPPANNRAPPI